MATVEGFGSLQQFVLPIGAYAKLSPDQIASAARYGIQRAYPSNARLYRQANEVRTFTLS